MIGHITFLDTYCVLLLAGAVLALKALGVV